MSYDFGGLHLAFGKKPLNTGASTPSKRVDFDGKISYILLIHKLNRR